MSWFTWTDLWMLAPVVIMVTGALITLLVGAMARGAAAGTGMTFLGIGTSVLAAFVTAFAWSHGGAAVGGALLTGPFAVFLGLVILAGVALALLYSDGYAHRMGFDVGEYYGLILLAGAGMLYLVAANDLITLLIAFEIMSLSVYALVAADRRRRAASEGAMKYFVLGAFASGILLYGMALLYGATGTIYLSDMAGVQAAPMLKLIGIGLMLIGLAFKVGAVPFHAWVPDAYQGAPASVTGFMAVAVKAAAFGILVRVLLASGLLGWHASETATGASTLATEHMLLTNVLVVLAIATMVVGNFLALAQNDLKRLLAYSGISHTGYVLIGLVAAMVLPAEGVTAVLYYLAAYTAMTIGAFAVLVVLATGSRDLGPIEDLAGLARRRPAVALAMTVCLVSLVGMPPTVGFFGKLWLFRAGLDAGFPGLVILAAVSTMVSIYYYLRPVLVMYAAAPGEAASHRPVPTAGTVVLAAAALATLLIGVAGPTLYDAARASAEALLSLG
ncbi:MAG: NADH-quinone oxidoreductase subunit N [Planctomycetota bacterium]|nr:MAG: NADH-quinone oxidoreductase subunit N [Planctomycetota bacterium]